MEIALIIIIPFLGTIVGSALVYLLKDKLRAKSYKDLFGVSKGRIKEILKLLDVKI